MPAKAVLHPKTLAEFSPYKKVRERTSAILDILYAQPDQRVYDRSGNATSKLIRLMPVSVMTGSNGRLMNPSSFNSQFQLMELIGWISRDINGKRVYEYKLIKGPDDWRPPVQTAQMTLTAPTDNGVQATEPVVEDTIDDEAREGGIRPGRLAARLEKIEETLSRSIPALVEEGVVAGINGFIAQLAIASGFYKVNTEDAANAENMRDLIRRLDEANTEQQKLTDELRAERVSNIAAREELNQTLRKQYATRDTTDVRPSEVPEAWRSLATHAINNGWTLHRTGGGHIMWKSPGGFRYFSSSTSSDFRSVRNARADMEKQGLPKE